MPDCIKGGPGSIPVEERLGRCPRPPGTTKSGLASCWMYRFSVSLSQMIPLGYDRLLEYAEVKYLHVWTFGTPLLDMGG